MAHDPTEHVQEHITHEAAHGGHEHGGGHASKWITAAALTAAFLAAFAAATGALATKHLTESMLKRIEANDKWNQYGQKSVKASNIDTRNFEYLIAKFNASTVTGGAVQLPADIEKTHSKDLAKALEYQDEHDPESMKGIFKEGKGLETLSGQHLTTHETFEFAATMFHIAIAIVAIAVVAKRKEFWYLSMVLGLVGLYFFTTALMHQPAHEGAHGEEHEAGSAHAGAASGHDAHGAATAHSPTGEHASPAAEHPESAHEEPAAH